MTTTDLVTQVLTILERDLGSLRPEWQTDVRAREVVALVQREVAAERERCARIADAENDPDKDHTHGFWSHCAAKIAAAIRDEEPKNA